MNAVPAPDSGPDAGAIWHYGDPLGEQRAAETDAVLVDRSHRAVLTLTGATPVPGLGEETVTGLGFTAGGLLLLPLAAVTGGVAFRPTLAALGWLAALATGPTALAYTLYFRGLRRAPASTGALLSLLEPLTATVLSVAFLGNRLGPTGIAGAVLLAAAVLSTARPGD